MTGEEAAPDRVAKALMIAGTALATVSVAAWGLNVLPAVPAWMIQLAIYKLTFISGAGLVIGGATLRRSLQLKRGDQARELTDGKDK